MNINKNRVLFYSVVSETPEYVKMCYLMIQSIEVQIPECHINVFTTSDRYDNILSTEPKLKKYLKVAKDYVRDCKYVGFLKFNEEVFSQDYDYFIMLDSDILFYYEGIYKLFGDNLGMVLLRQSHDFYHYHHYIWTEEEKQEYSNPLLSADFGFFGLPKNICLDMSEFAKQQINKFEINKYSSDHHPNEIRNIAFAEQSLYNKFILLNQLDAKLLSLSDMIINIPPRFTKEQVAEIAKKNHHNKIYHFPTFNNGIGKLQNMQYFLEITNND